MLWRKARKVEDFAAEVEAHLAHEEDELKARGVPAAEARAEARRRFGNATLRQEDFFEGGRAMFLDRLWRDARQAARGLGRERAFAAFAVLLIGLGTGAMTAMFALYHGVALRKMAVPDADALVLVEGVREDENRALRYALFERLRETFDLAEGMLGWSGTLFPMTYEGQTSVLSVAYVAGDAAQTLGLPPVAGRWLTPGETAPVAMIGEPYWRKLGGDPAIIGKTLRAGDYALTIVGVAPAGAIELTRFYRPDVLTPLEVGLRLESVARERLPRYWLGTVARLKPGVHRRQAEQQLQTLWPRLVEESAPEAVSAEEWKRLAGRGIRLSPGAYGASSGSDLSKVSLALLVLAALGSLAMCTNLAGLLLSRGLGRRREYAMRLALGAKRWDLVRFSLVEVSLLAAGGVVVGLVVARGLTALCLESLRLGNTTVAVDYGVRLDVRALLVAMLVAGATALGAQLAPAWRISGAQAADWIKSGAHTFSPRLGFRKVILGVQLAASLVLVSSAVLFQSTLESLARVELGFDARGLWGADVMSLVPWSNAGPEYFQELLRRVRSIPGVESAGLSDSVPMRWNFELKTAIAGGRRTTTAEVSCVWPGYVEALGVRLLAGREPGWEEASAALISSSVAQELFPGEPAVGQLVRVAGRGKEMVFTVSGVVGDVRLRTPRQSSARSVLIPCRAVWEPPQTAYAMGLTIRAHLPPAVLEAALQGHLKDLGKQVVKQVRSVDALAAAAVRNERTLSTIATGFSGFVLVLMSAGVYGLVDLAGRARMREFSVRVALGATPGSLLRLMLGSMAAVLLGGVAAGAGLTWGAWRAYRAHVDAAASPAPEFFAVAAGVVTALTLVAAIAPAWRAARVAPATVLRS
ncbi:MAG TPA: hypothetical protein DEH78_13685 [Solibacterales bacterium]|nr:hypothetical protein [Bryobacterales bacterium]